MKELRKIKILFVSHNLELEGAPKSFFILAKGFKKKGFDVDVISLKPGPLKVKYNESGMNVIKIDSFRDKFLIDVVSKYDAIFVNTISAYSFIKELYFLNKKIIWIIRESELYEYKNKFLDLTDDLFDKVFKVVFVSNATRSLYENGKVHDNFKTIYNGFEIADYEKYKKSHEDVSVNIFLKDKIKKKYGFEIYTRIVSIIGTVCSRKGQLEFCQAIAVLRTMLPEKYFNNLRFLIIGAQDKEIPYVNKISEFIEENDLSRNIKLLKETSKIYDYYEMSDIFVCNSYIESFPRVVLEAMAFSLPIIATKIYGIPEQIRNKKEGLLINAGDVNALAEQMMLVLNDADMARTLGENANIRLKDDFSNEKTFSSYLKLLEDD